MPSDQFTPLHSDEQGPYSRFFNLTNSRPMLAIAEPTIGRPTARVQIEVQKRKRRRQYRRQPQLCVLCTSTESGTDAHSSFLVWAEQGRHDDGM